MHRNKTITGAAAVVAAVGLIGTGAALSNAATTPTPSPSASTAPTTPGGVGGHAHTPVTGSELAKVTAAVKAKDSAVTVTSVVKDPDGSYDVLGTKAGAQVRLEASADLKTVGAATPGGPGRGGPGGPGGGHAHTPVTGTELAKVTAAVKAKDSAVTVTSVQKDPDGSYDVLGTKAGADVRLEASADLKTIGAATPGGPGGRGGPGGPQGTPVTGAELTKVTAAVKAKDAAVTVTAVHEGPDGSYHVHGTKAGAPVHLEVSADLKTVTVREGRPGAPRDAAHAPEHHEHDQHDEHGRLTTHRPAEGPPPGPPRGHRVLARRDGSPDDTHPAGGAADVGYAQELGKPDLPEPLLPETPCENSNRRRGGCPGRRLARPQRLW